MRRWRLASCVAAGWAGRKGRKWGSQARPEAGPHTGVQYDTSHKNQEIARGAARENGQKSATTYAKVKNRKYRPQTAATGPALPRAISIISAFGRASTSVTLTNVHTLQTQSFQSNSHVCILRYC